MAKVILLDGNSLTYRAFFALPTDMTTASGQVTNAVFGFTSMLLNLIKDQDPDGVVVAFDRPEPTFRHEMLPEYKAQRDPTPELLIQQFEVVREVLQVLNIPAVDLLGFEADDVLATLATELAEGGDEAIIVTGDRDIYQMVRDPLIKVLYNRRGVSDYALYDEAVRFVTESRKASISAVQRKLRIGYNRAARMIESMEMAGVVSEMGSNGAREVIAPPHPLD